MHSGLGKQKDWVSTLETLVVHGALLIKDIYLLSSALILKQI